METKKILFGFTDEKFEKTLKDLLRSVGYEAEIYARSAKNTVREALKKNPDMDAVVLTETLEGAGLSKRQKYVAEELAALADESNANVVVVLSANHKGTDYARVLLDAGITGAIFVGAQKVVTAKEVATLIVRKRTKKEARDYYGIGHEKADLGFLDLDAYNELYSRFRSREGTPIENYIFICQNLSEVKQIADFTKRLPKDDKDYLANFEEFHAVLSSLKEMGFDLQIERPKKVFVGLKSEAQIDVANGALQIRSNLKKKEEGGVSEKRSGIFASIFARKKEGKKAPKAEKEDTAPVKPVKEEEIRKEEPVKETPVKDKAGEAPLSAKPYEKPEVLMMEEETKDDDFGNMSFEDMIALMSGVPRSKEGEGDRGQYSRQKEVCGGTDAAGKKPFVEPEKEDSAEPEPVFREQQAPEEKKDEWEEHINPYPLFSEEQEDIELKDLKPGKNGVYVAAIIVLAALLGGLWYIGGGGIGGALGF